MPAPSSRRCLPQPVIGVLALVVLLAGCGERAPRAPWVADTAVAGQTAIDARLASDPQVDELVAPYRATLESQMGEALAYCPVPMETGRPEGLLGALVSDIILERARRETGLPVAAAIQNNGGLRVPWTRGVITLGLVYEVMPFDNAIVVLRFTAEQMRALADELAARGGEPVAGLTFRIRDGAADELRVGGEPLGAQDYWVATNDYLAGGGGGMPTLWEPRETRSAEVLVRDAIADALRGYGARAQAAERPGPIPVPALGRIRVGR